MLASLMARRNMTSQRQERGSLSRTVILMSSSRCMYLKKTYDVRRKCAWIVLPLSSPVHLVRQESGQPLLLTGSSLSVLKED